MFYRFNFQTIRQTSIDFSKCWIDKIIYVVVFSLISDFWLFIPLIVLLNPVLNCSKSVLSFSVDKVTTGHTILHMLF